MRVDARSSLAADEGDVSNRGTQPRGQLARLDELRRSGALTQPEFNAAKYRLLRGDRGCWNTTVCSLTGDDPAVGG